MNREQIRALLPHREPMLLLDTVELADGNSVGTYTVRGDEFFLQGHFPGNPVVPGVILCEMMAQTCCALFAADGQPMRTPYFTGLNNVKFKRRVLPGETIMLTCSITRRMANFYFAKGLGEVNGQLAVSGEFSFALGEQSSPDATP